MSNVTVCGKMVCMTQGLGRRGLWQKFERSGPDQDSTVHDKSGEYLSRLASSSVDGVLCTSVPTADPTTRLQTVLSFNITA